MAAHQSPLAPACHAADPHIQHDVGPPVVHPAINYAAMATAQRSCPGVATLGAARSLSIVTRDVEGHLLEEDITTRVFRPVVPNSFQSTVFNAIHDISHQGIRATKRLILSRFGWKHAVADITLWSRACLSCQRGKITKHMHAKPLNIPMPTCTWT